MELIDSRVDIVAFQAADRLIELHGQCAAIAAIERTTRDEGIHLIDQKRDLLLRRLDCL
jgi:hypothetical protein